MQYHVGFLNVFGFIFFGIGLFGFFGSFDPALSKISDDFVAAGIRSYPVGHLESHTAEYKESLEFWLGFAFYTSKVTFVGFVVMAASMWINAYRSFKVRLEDIFIYC